MIGCFWCRIRWYHQMNLDPLQGRLRNLIMQEYLPKFEFYDMSRFIINMTSLNPPIPDKMISLITTEATFKLHEAKTRDLAEVLCALARSGQDSPVRDDLFLGAFRRLGMVMAFFPKTHSTSYLCASAFENHMLEYLRPQALTKGQKSIVDIRVSTKTLTSPMMMDPLPQHLLQIQSSRMTNAAFITSI